MVQTGEETDDDGNLIAQIVAAQEAANPKKAHRFFGILYRRHAAAVAACLYSLAWPIQIDDLAQDTWMRAWAKLNTFKTGSFRAWILQIARRCCVDSKRRSRPQLLPFDADVLDPSPQIEREQAEQAERAEVLRDCLSKLDDRRRRVLVELLYENADYETVCRKLGLTSDAAYKLTFEARRRLTHSCRQAMR
jgi:RNA polymerase sigma-70 factor (ECF subfamily)